MSSRIKTAWRAYAALDRRIWILAAVRAASTMGLALVMAFMGIYLVTERGLSGQAYGWIFFIANLAQSATQGYAGELSDRAGRRPVMTVALLLRGVVIAALGGLVLAGAPILLLSLTLVVSASLRGGFDPVAYAVVADVAGPDQRVAAFGLQRMGTNLGWAIGPALGGFLTAVLPYGVVFFLAAPSLILSAWATARLADARPRATETDVPRRRSGGPVAGRAELGLFLACALLFALFHIQLFSTLSIYATSELALRKEQIGLLYTVNGVGVLLAQLPAVALIGRLGNERALVFASALYWVGFVAVGLSPGALYLAGAFLIVTCGEVILAPAQQAAAAELGDPRRLGRAFGLLGAMRMIGVACAPLFGGLAYDTLRSRPLLMWGGVFGTLCALTLAGYVAFGISRRRARGTLARG